ncbi:murein DD-endopeptidase MepM/ murein hydrolase activator NlpD [Sphingomonas aerolata]|uniref:Murein DD-endopeptidase MepM/ murein hydrolase activator NlpD n=1 Tax=Sphingomonas aerolata TaxID=185951 RepID=A0A2T4YMR7_9SPHN|nr:peptidoglycan DD-metalloendopeptidase family protein [Sphingomonas aerolata]PTM44703.1 murein DD-endopeptidase MepM/ murein hydrolase activator NlpD [Sphingomonas aerolata]
MSARTQVDSVLVIRARDEATKAVTAIGNALEQLIGTQKKVASGSESAASGMQQILGVLASLDKAYARTAESSDAGAAALERQNRAIAASKAQYTALEAQQRGAARAADQLRVALVDALLTNGNADVLRAQIGEVTTEMRRLESEADKLQRTIAQQEAGFTRAASGMAELERQTRLAGAVSTFAAQEAADYARSLDNQTAAAQRNAAVLKTIARATGTDRGSAVDNGATFGLLEKQAAASEAAAAAERSRAQAAELTNNALRARARIEGNGGSAGRAADTVFAQQLRDEEDAAQGAARAEKELVDATARLRAELNPMATIQANLNTEVAEANRLYKAGKISATELGAATELLRGRAAKASAALNGSQGMGAGGKPLLFGLKPYEMQNLGYQVNDVVTQLASGTSLTQTLGQQAGQIVQIFPRVGSAIVGAFTNPAILGFVAVIGTVAIALKSAGDEAERTRKFMGLLAASADGATYGAKALNESAEALDRYGLSAADAVTVVRGFVKDGVNPARIVEFGEAAQDLADVLGIKVVDAAQQVSEAFTGGYDSVKKLDDATNFLTSTQRDNIKSLFDQGKAAEARNEALRIFSEQQEDAAQKSRGAWSEATRSLSTAWSDFLNVLSNTDAIKEVAKELEGLGRIASQAIRAISGAQSAADVAAQIARAKQVIANKEAAKGANPGLVGALDADIAVLRTQIAGLEKQYAALNGTQKQLNDTVAVRGELTKKQSVDLAAQTEAAKSEKSVLKATNEARRTATEYVEKNFKFASEATKQAYISQKAEEARTAALKKAADERKREADQAKRLADERKREQERLAKQTAFQAPVDGRISSGFGARAAPKAGASTFHKGVDYAVPSGTTVRAPAEGVVIETGTDSKLGKFVYIDHGKGTISKFSHLSDNNVVAQGQVVTAGQAIAKSGNTGNSTGAHLHYTVTVNGKPVDPTKGLFPADGKSRFQVDQADAIDNYDDAQQKLADKRDAYLAKVDETSAAMVQDTEQLREQQNLTDGLLLAAQRKAAIEDAVRKAETDATQAGVAPDDAGLALRIERLREVTGAYFDAAHAKDAFQAQQNSVDKPVADLTAQRDAMRDQVTFLRDSGLNAEADSLLPMLGQVNTQLQGAVDKAIAFYAALSPGDNPLGLTAAQLATINTQLTIAKQSSAEWGTILDVSVEQIADAFANTLTSAIDGFVQALVDGQSAFGALKNAFLDFAANFLRLISQMILQQIALNIAKGVISAIGGGGPVPAQHTGGVVGQNTSGSRFMSSAAFAGASRFHTGGIAGLRPDEVPIIAQRGEEILTRGDPRHRANGGLGGGAAPMPKITVVNALDAGDIVSKGLDSGVGGKAFLNYIRANSAAVKQVLG